jgi:hypothetical protein
MGEMINEHKIMVGKPEGKRPLPENRWDDNIHGCSVSRAGECELVSSGSGQRLLIGTLAPQKVQVSWQIE